MTRGLPRCTFYANTKKKYVENILLQVNGMPDVARPVVGTTHSTLTILGVQLSLLTYLSPLAATGCQPPINCAHTSGAPVTAYASAPPHQREGQQRVVILSSWLIVNRLDNREYYSLTTSRRGESRRTECTLTFCCSR